MPQCFQGRAWFAVIFEPEQRERIYGLVAGDGNGCWKDKNRRFGRGKKLDDERTPFVYMKKDWYSWPNGQSNGFKRRILALVESNDKWKVPLGNFLVVEYSWQEGSTTQQFKPEKPTRTAPLPVKCGNWHHQLPVGSLLLPGTSTLKWLQQFLKWTEH
ncbi:hypothetical protein RvY_01306-2 [Ramazzottius varieornatus]|uniref:Uncharacterized protein n=1 Tax=Ramazzottius varieornatus TaxID=947166 RepID=A0A1D1ULX9_RAMVA|nr:hypothetical protein RvY_01306-2 [Ramazzottius varieornatus]